MLCSHVAVMSAGKIVAQGLIEDLRNEEPTRLILRTDDVDLAVETLKSAGIGKAKILGDQITCEVDPALDVASLNGKLVRKKGSVKEIRLQRSSLEEKYVKLTGEGFEVVS